MPRLTNRNPKYCKHASGQAFVKIDGTQLYLGPWGTEASRKEYDRIVAEWLANGRRLPGQGSQITVAELILQYWEHAKRYYRSPEDAGVTGELSPLRQVLRVMRETYGHTRAIDFGPLALKAVREKMITAGWIRKSINKQINRLRQMFRWAVENEKLPAASYHALRAVAPLLKGRTEAKEASPVEPADEDAIQRVQGIVNPAVRDMIDLQLLTGMRPGEVTRLRACDLDMSEAVWTYKPPHHKTEHHGHARQILLGPKAQELIKRRLTTNLAAWLFIPKEATEYKSDLATCHRRPDQAPNRRQTRRKVGDRYTVAAYRRAVQRACEKVGIKPAWHPHQLRHNAGTRLRKEFGIEVARIVLGHQNISATEIYAQEDLERAAAVMARVG